MAAGGNMTALQSAREMAALYTKAEMAVLSSQAYSIGGQSLTRADLDKIRKGRQEWEAKVAVLERGGLRRVRRAIYRDD